MFSHRPLVDTRSIRLLRVHGSSSCQSPIECDIIHTSLDYSLEEVCYEAISYCWADQTPTQIVYVEGQDALATKNCEAALRRFRPKKENKMRFLWIDSLCIDQKNWAERSRQVILMGEIYSKAEQVLVWLGNESGPVEGVTPRAPQYYIDAFNWMTRIAKAAEEEDNENRAKTFLQLLQESRVLDMTDIVDLVPWFKRLWVVQEAAMSQRAIIFYDQVTIPLESIFKAGRIIGDLENSGEAGPEANSNPYWSAFSVHQLAKRTLESSRLLRNTNNSTICDFLGEMRWSRCSNAKDKIFGLHGLLAAASVSVPPPDYSKSTADIYREATIAVMLSTRNIRILEQVDGLGKTPDLASWVPDWSSSMHSIGLLDNYYAALPYSCNPFFALEDKFSKLILKGAKIDVITARSTLSFAHTSERLGQPKKYLTWSQNSQPTEPFWKNLLCTAPQHSTAILFLWNFRVSREFIAFALDNRVAAASEESVRALYYTLMCLCSSHVEAREDQAEARLWFSVLCGEGLDPKDDEEASTLWKAQIIRSIHETPQLAGLMRTQEYETYKQISRRSICRTFEERIDRLRYRTIFRTATGKLGTAPYSILPGDIIIRFTGVRLLMIVRPLGTDYKLIAQTHVEGIGRSELKESVFNEITLV